MRVAIAHVIDEQDEDVGFAHCLRSSAGHASAASGANSRAARSVMVCFIFAPFGFHLIRQFRCSNFAVGQFSIIGNSSVRPAAREQ